jgi:ergothioneine biosynthesis protein EgtB
MSASLDVAAARSGVSQTAAIDPAGGSTADLASRYAAVRAATRGLAEPLELEDYGLQSMPDASPVKWHLAHTTWFFEEFVLARQVPGHVPFHPRFGYLFNSYYESVGRMHPRSQRGLLTRPTVAEVWRWREQVDLAMAELFARGVSEEAAAVIEVGLQHEQQHQELVLTDLKHGFSCNLLRPVYRERATRAGTEPSPVQWLEHEGGLVEVGHSGQSGRFGFDNEFPRHRAWLQPFAIASRLVTCGEWLEFMADDGYQRADLWLSAGWEVVQRLGWQAPLYWSREDEREGAGDREPWRLFTLAGLRAIDPAEPVCHVSLYEADAFARWRGARLPTEHEWEHACGRRPVAGNFVESGLFHPCALAMDHDHGDPGPHQAFGDVWEWTSSAYAPYPGYRPWSGSLGEYNGKFMCNQLVLRGGSCATPASHARASYRNFFPPEARWQFSGLRLARDPCP